MRGLSNTITSALLIVVAISLSLIIFLSTNRYVETEHIHVELSKASKPTCINGTCHILLDLRIKNYNQKLYTIRALYFSIISTHNVTQKYFGYNPSTKTCTRIQTVEVVGDGCTSDTCYLALCYGNITLPDLAERTFSIRISFNQSDFITEVAVVVVLYDVIGNEYRVASNSVRIL